MIVVNNPTYSNQIAEASGVMFNIRSDQSIARVENGKLCGGALFTGYTKASIHMHMAGFVPRWINRELLFACFDYPFRQLGVERAFGQVPETNSKALEIDRKLGFKIVARIEGVFPDGACMVLVLEKADCRWLALKKPIRGE